MAQSMPHATPPRRPLPRHVAGSLVGTSVGLLAFFFAALLPSLLYGGVAGIRVANELFSLPSAHPVSVHALMFTGILVSVTAVAALFAVLGVVVGASVGALSTLGADR